MTLEERLITYNWQTNFQNFAIAIRTGTFKSMCSNTKGMLLPETAVESHYPRIIQAYQDPEIPCTRKSHRKKLSMLLSEDDVSAIGNDVSYIVQKDSLVRNNTIHSSNASLTSVSIVRYNLIIIVLSFYITTFR
jgi:urease alpha subunit